MTHRGDAVAHTTRLNKRSKTKQTSPRLCLIGGLVCLAIEFDRHTVDGKRMVGNPCFDSAKLNSSAEEVGDAVACFGYVRLSMLSTFMGAMLNGRKARCRLTRCREPFRAASLPHS